MRWTGKILGALIGFLIAHRPWGALVGALIGHLFDQAGYGGAPGSRGAGASAAAVSAEFFRTAFELMGYVAKSDGRVSEAEIEAARRLMRELKLGPPQTEAAISCFRAGKAAGYDAKSAIARLRGACAEREELLRAFIELQIRAALAGNGMSPPARSSLLWIAGQLGMPAAQFLQLEAALRAWQGQQAGGSGPPGSFGSLEECYAVLEIDAHTSDQEVRRAYRRQMSRHHPDKLIANGLPESMTQIAKERTQRIQRAYEGIRAARGMR